MDDSRAGGGEAGPVKPMSAYNHFYKTNSAALKEELQREGGEVTLGALTSFASSRWKSLDEVARKPYDTMAEEDRARYESECNARDEEVLRRQEERRKANTVGGETSSRMRTSTVINTTTSTIENTKRRREVSEEVRERQEEKRRARAEETAARKEEMESLQSVKAKQAEARLKYLLSQSDMFSHFGAAKAAASEKPDGSSTSKSLHRTASVADDEEMDDDATSKNTVLLAQPSCIQGQMRAYQLEGLNWMIRLHENGINGILADEMGLGKTLQSISILGYVKEFENVGGPHLVMVPKSTLPNWCNEFRRWCPSLRILRLHGDKDERRTLIEENLDPAKLRNKADLGWDVLVTTYEVVNIEKTALARVNWRYLIIDEAHRLKNEQSAFSKTVRLLNTEHRLLITGTPLQNNLHELWALLNFLLPEVFDSADQFDEWFDLDVDDQELKQRMISQLHKLLRPFMLRRLKADVEKSLPPKNELILFTGMSEMQRTLYKQILQRNIETITTASSSNSQQSRTAVLNLVMQLRKCCNHPYLFDGVEDRTLDPLGDHLFNNCGKMVLLDKLLSKLHARGHRVLVFTQMTRMLDILEDYFQARSYQYCRIDGNTTYEDREDRIADFNRPDSDKFSFILSTRAGGLGINLQTADTVILYDSDWNPQADLQAQDRAHRIGQKKPVQVYRFVTEDSVEVKVVERAQQKLKLDAMVVQQGRLQEKEKKLSKDDLLDTLRFGADKIFRSNDSTISDADIDMILEEGRKRTEELNEKLHAADKGDMYDFRLDGGMSMQVFEGKDYSDRKERDMLLTNLVYSDLGKRGRRTVQSYSETQVRVPRDDEERRPKLPRHLRLNRMDDWQFFNKARLNELQAEEMRLFDELVDRGEAPSTGNISKLVVLPPELAQEKQTLLDEGFGSWTRVHFNNFIRASAKYGRTKYDKIAKDVDRPVDETKRYAETFWSRGETELPLQEWERVVKQIEKGEKRLEEIERLTVATARLINMFENPWEELTFKNAGSTNRNFTSVEDRYLLCLTHLHGYGNWEQIRNSIRHCENFRFDYYLQSCSAETIGKRCELLMRSAERELLEIERKRQSAENSTEPQKPSQADTVKQKMSELSVQIAETAERLANTRAQIQKLKTNEPIARPEKKKPVATAAASASSEEKSSEKKTPSSRAQSVGEDLYPELCQLLLENPIERGLKLVEKFVEMHPEVSKRQVEMKISEIAVKEKREEDEVKVWHIRDEFEKFVPSDVIRQKATKQPRSAPKRKRPASLVTEEPGPEGSTNEEELPIVTKEPTRPKRAFRYFVTSMRKTAEKSLGENIDPEALKARLKEMWESASEEDREKYLTKEAKDKARYDRELISWNKYKATQQNTDDDGEVKRKVKRSRKEKPVVEDDEDVEEEKTTTTAVTTAVGNDVPDDSAMEE